jgi:hypothetical protein
MDPCSVAGLVLGVGLLKRLRLACVTIAAGWTTYRPIPIDRTPVMDEDNNTKLNILFAAHHTEVLALLHPPDRIRREGVSETSGCSRSGREHVHRFHEVSRASLGYWSANSKVLEKGPTKHLRNTGSGKPSPKTHKQEET